MDEVSLEMSTSMTWFICAVGLSYTFSEIDSVFPVIPLLFDRCKISEALVIIG